MKIGLSLMYRGTNLRGASEKPLQSHANTTGGTELKIAAEQHVGTGCQPEQGIHGPGLIACAIS